MAVSNYFYALIVLIIAYPVYIMVASIMIYDQQYKKKQVRWVTFITFVSILILGVLHFNTHVEYGKELLDFWYATHPEDRPANYQ